MNQYTRYFTVALAALQGWGISVWLSSLKVSVSGVQVSALADDFATGAGNIGFRLLATLTFTAGTIFVMYLGEQITSHGVGNGISLIIFAGIVGGLPRAFLAQWEMFKEDIQPLASEIIILAIVVVIIGFIVFVEQANRRIPLQRAWLFPNGLLTKHHLPANNIFSYYRRFPGEHVPAFVTLTCLPVLKTSRSYFCCPPILILRSFFPK